MLFLFSTDFLLKQFEFPHFRKEKISGASLILHLAWGAVLGGNMFS